MNVSRRGSISLIELLTVVFVSTVLLAIVTSATIRLGRHGRSAPARIARQVALARLTDQFRGDVHAARQVERGDPGTDRPLLVCRLDGGETATWRQRGEVLIRVAESAGATHAREAYRLPPAAAATLELDPPSPGRLARLRLEYRRGGDSLGTPRQFEIHAVVGRDLRWLPADRGDAATAEKETD